MFVKYYGKRNGNMFSYFLIYISYIHDIKMHFNKTNRNAVLISFTKKI